MSLGRSSCCPDLRLRCVWCLCLCVGSAHVRVHHMQLACLVKAYTGFGGGILYFPQAVGIVWIFGRGKRRGWTRRIRGMPRVGYGDGICGLDAAGLENAQAVPLAAVHRHHHGVAPDDPSGHQHPADDDGREHAARRPAEAHVWDPALDRGRATAGGGALREAAAARRGQRRVSGAEQAGERGAEAGGTAL
eukprot:518798-Rhodomonas_salina.1